MALGLDYVVPNEFFVPIGIWNGAPFGVGYYIWKSTIPAAIGNMAGGGLFVGGVYWYLYLTGEDVEVSFNIGGLQSAMEVGGPMGRVRKFDTQRMETNPENGLPVIEGVENHGMDGEEYKIASPARGGKMNGDHLPHSGGPLQSSVGMELSEKYTKRKGSDESERMTV